MRSQHSDICNYDLASRRRITRKKLLFGKRRNCKYLIPSFEVGEFENLKDEYYDELTTSKPLSIRRKLESKFYQHIFGEDYNIKIYASIYVISGGIM